MAKLAFNDLPQAVRARFVAATHNAAQPPVLAERERYSGFVFVVVALVIGLALLAYSFLSWGELGTPYPRHSVGEVDLMLAVSLFVVITCVVTWVCRRVWPGPPWRRGTYVVPGYLVEAFDRSMLEIIPWPSVGGATITQVRRRRGIPYTLLTFSSSSGSGSHSFRYSDHDPAAQALARIQQVQATFAQAHAARDGHTVGQLDVFFECTTTGQWTDPAGTPTTAPSVKARPGWVSALPWLAGMLVVVTVIAIVLSRQAREREAEKARVAKYQAGKTAASTALLDRYRAHAGTPAAESFVVAAMAHNAAQTEKTLCVQVDDMPEEDFARLDVALRAANRKAGDKFKPLADTSNYRPYRKFSEHSHGTTEMLGEVLTTALGDAEALKVIGASSFTEKTCPTVTVKARFHTTQPNIAQGKAIYGALAARFEVTTVVPGSPPQPAFELDVPAPDLAGVKARAQTVIDQQGNGNNDAVYKATVELAWDSLNQRLKTHFVK